LGFMSPFVWMFISSYKKLRSFLINQKTITSLVQLEYSGFDGATVPICTFTVENAHNPNFKGGYVRLSDFRGAENQGPKTLEAIENPSCGWFFYAAAANFKKIPGNPIAYWLSESMIRPFEIGANLGDETPIKSGMSTTDNSRFLRYWSEISKDAIKLDASSLDDAKCSGQKWFPFKKGGEFRRWDGNNDFVLNWKNDGEEIKTTVVNNPNDPNTTHWSRRIFGVEYFFKPGITWTKISSGKFAARYHGLGHIFSDASNGCFPLHDCNIFLGFLNSKVVDIYLLVLSPTLNFKSGDIAQLPVITLSNSTKAIIKQNVESLVRLSNVDWSFFETSWDFTSLPLLQIEHYQPTLKASYTQLREHWQEMTLEMQRLEEENNRIFIDTYGLQDELTPEVPPNKTTLICNPQYRYSGNNSEEKLEALLITDTMKEFISYTIGCMMGRYSLDEPGLIYANNGNEGFDHLKYKTFPADDDGIVPVMDLDWFSDDATNRFIEFLKVAWAPDTLDENLKFVANSLSSKKNETPIDTIRRYLSTKFFKDHIKTYKKRPIYWLFSSGKQKAFECLVYLHRYNESTLARIRSAYVTPLQGKFNARIEYLQAEINAAETTSARKKRQKELEVLKKKKTEIAAFDDELRHYADMKIQLDLDDGVKVNYGKFGSLLAEKKIIAGKK